MRRTGIIFGLLLALTGAVWMLQGLRVAFAPKSFMTGRVPWVFYGAVAVAAGHGRSIGFTDREKAMRSLLGDMVPDAVLSRSSKASFHSVFWGPNTRRFVSRWSGAMPYPDLVDAPKVVAKWQANAVVSDPGAVTPNAAQSVGQPRTSSDSDA